MGRAANGPTSRINPRCLCLAVLAEIRSEDVRSRSHHRRRRAVGAVGRDRREAARPRLPGARAGRAGQLDLPVSAADGVLHDAGAARDRRSAVHVAVREADARRGAATTTARSWTSTTCGSRYEETVTAISREARRETTVFAVETRSSRGVRRVRHARHVVMAIGYYDHPIMLGIPGEDLPHVHHYYSEPHVYYRQRVVVVGGAQLGGRSGARDVSRRRARDARPPRRGAEVDDQVLGAAGHREPDQGRIDRGAVQHAASRRSGRRRSS